MKQDILEAIDNLREQVVNLLDHRVAGGLSRLPEKTPVLVFAEDWNMGLGGWDDRGEGSFYLMSMNDFDDYLEFSASVQTRYVPHIANYTPLKNGTYRVSYRMRCEDLGEKGHGVRVELRYKSTAGWRWPSGQIHYGTHGWQEFSFEAVVSDYDSGGNLRITRHGNPETGMAFIDDIRVEYLEPPPVELFLLRPNYRGYLTGNEIEGWVSRPCIVDLRNAQGQVIRTLPVDGEVFTLYVDLEPGTYYLSASYGDYTTPDYQIEKTSTWGRLVRFDENNVLWYHGDPLFPIGAYVTSGYSLSEDYYENNHLEAMPSVSTLINYHQTKAPPEAVKAYLRAQDPYCINYLATVNNWYPGYSESPLLNELIPGLGTIEDQTQADMLIERFAKAVKADNLLGYYVMDERKVEDVPRHFAQYQAIKRADPDSLTFGVSNRMHELEAWRDTMDVLGVDPYPLVNMKLGTPLSQVGEWTRKAVEATHGSRPVWTVIQFFQGQAADRWPTYEELRTMCIMAIVEGARGLFFWSFGARGLAWVKDEAERGEYLLRLTSVIGELNALDNFLIAPDEMDVVKSVSDDRVRWLVRYNYIFAYMQAEHFDEREDEDLTEVEFELLDGKTFRRFLKPDTAEYFTIEPDPLAST